MDNSKTLDHFCKTYLPILTALLKEMNFPDNCKDFGAQVDKVFLRSPTLSLKSEPDESYDNHLTNRIAEVFSLGGEYIGPVKETVQKARELTTKSIAEAPYMIVSDFGEAADYMLSFAADSERRSVMFGVDTGMSGKRYAVFKLPYNDRIDFFFGKQDYFSSPSFSIGDDMKYLGFFDKEAGVLYDLREPLDMCWFHRPREEVNNESSAALRKRIQRAFQNEVARRVEEKVPELPEVPPPDELLAMFAQVEAEYGSSAADSSFADKVDHSHIFIHANDPVRFVLEPESLIAERVDEYMKWHGVEVDRRWISHLAARQILSYTAALGDAAGMVGKTGS